MGLTVDNFHIRTHDRSAVVTAIEQPALVSPANNSWVSVYPFGGPDNTPLSHADLSTTLDTPVVAFFCFDSDIAVAELAHQGELVALLTASHPETATMMMGSAPSEPVLVQGDPFTLWADLQAWTQRLGQLDEDSLFGTLAEDVKEPFAETSAITFLKAFGLNAARLTTAYRFLQPTAEQDQFLHT